MKVILSVVILALSIDTRAAQSLSTKINNNYNSIRALGMGNAFTAVADDYSLIMYNPAGFARKKQNEVQFTLLGAGVSSKTLTVANDIKKASDTVGTDNDKAQAISNELEKYYGESLGGKVQLLEMFWVRQGWGFAILPADLTIDMTINKQLGPAIDLNVKGDTIVAFGFGKQINKYFDAGITLKGTHRVSVEQSVSAFELASDSNVLSDKRFKEGTNFDFDIGFLWRPNWFNKKTVEIEPAKVEAAPVEPVVEEKAATLDDELKEDNKEPKSEKVTEQASEDKKDDNVESEKAVKEEERKPQAEGEAEEAKLAEEGDKKTEEKTEESLKKDLADKEKETADKKTTETKKDSAKKEVVKKKEVTPETEVVKEAKTEEQAVDESEERFPLTFGLVMHNSLDGVFTLSKLVNKNATEVPTKMYRVVDIGSQYLLRDGEDFKIRAMLDFKNILHPNITLNKSTHYGLEFDFSPSSWFKTQLRGGFNQMYYTAGASFLFGIFNFDLVTYGEEVGSSSQKIENRVLAAKVALNF